MKVQDLIELLEAQDPNADVYLMSQQNWPFEHRIYGVAARADFTEEDVGFEPDDGGDRWGAAEASSWAWSGRTWTRAGSAYGRPRAARPGRSR